MASAGVLAVVFASGGLVGMAVQRSIASDAIAEVPTPSTDGQRQVGPGSNGFNGNRGRPQRSTLYAQVLSAEQIVVADSIVQAVETRRDSLERAFRRDMDSVFQASPLPQQHRTQREALTTQLRASIRGLMTAEQLVVYDSLLADADAERQAERERQQRERQQRGDSATRQGRPGNPPN